MPALLHIELPATPDGVPKARWAVTRLCKQLAIDRERTQSIRLAVTEAATTCVLHSQGGDEQAPAFVVEASVEAGDLVVVVRDFGGRVVRAPTEIGARGLGLLLIRRLADGSDVSSRPGGALRVAMRFALAPQG